MPRAYLEAVARAEYYRWNATRARTLPGNDPISGLPRDRFGAFRGESRAAYVAMARYWLSVARRLRSALTR